MGLGGDKRGDEFDQNPMYETLQDLIVSVKTVKPRTRECLLSFQTLLREPLMLKHILMFDVHEVKHVRKHFY